jgi:outer membrane phospholipase A
LTLNAASSSNTVTIAPGAFRKTEYLLSLPPGITGPVRFEATNYSPVLFTITGGSSATNLATMPPLSPPPPAGASPQVSEKLMKFLDKHISPYEPIYFLLGSYPAAKFQFSLKYEVLAFTNKNNPLSDLYFAYTQTSFWDLVSKDPAFYDTSYKPSAFLYYPDLALKPIDSKLDLQAGMEHESNGRGGVEERSLNTIYFQPTLTYQPTDDFSFSLQPRAWYYLTVGDYDTDLANYRGYGDVLGTVRWKAIAFATKLRMGKDWDHQGWQFDLWFQLPDWFHFNPALQVEYFTGYGQTLRQYNVSSHGIRGGLSLWY